VQNDPSGRTAKFGHSSVYWNSRLKAMLWAAVYSAYFEIGPVLSETAIGNEGGYTYIPKCGFFPTCQKLPGRTYKPPTNNTGWVDFVVTPTIGTGWMLLEDAIEVNLVDRLAKGRHDLSFDLLRSALSPSHTLANVLAGKLPWYRYGDDHPGGFLSSQLRPAVSRPLWKDEPRRGFGIQFTSMNFPVDREDCASCRSFHSGVGLIFDYRLARFVYLDNELNFFPGKGSYGEKGSVQEELFGVKIGNQGHNWGLFSQARSGFVHYSKALAPGTSSDYESTTRFAIDFGGTVEYYASRHTTIRLNVGTTLIHYLTGMTDPRQPPVSVLSSEYYVYQGNFHLSNGVIYRF
jgi:hypothetical protein